MKGMVNAQARILSVLVANEINPCEIVNAQPRILSVLVANERVVLSDKEVLIPVLMCIFLNCSHIAIISLCFAGASRMV